MRLFSNFGPLCYCSGSFLEKTRQGCDPWRTGIDIDLFISDSGGYASYVMGHTSTYTDVDLFVRCFGQLKPQLFSAGNVLVEVKGNVVSFLISGLVFQVVQVRV